MTDPAHSTSPRWLSWLICLSAGLFFFYEFFQLNVFDVINPYLRQAFDLNAAQLSWLSSTFVWANVLFLLPAGIILDRMSVRWVIIVAMALCVIGTMGFALTHQFIWAAFWRALTGVGNAFCFLSCVILVARWFPPRRQALVIGCLVTMAFIGGMTAHTPLAYLITHLGWRKALLLDGALGIGLWFWIVLIVKDKRISPIKTSTSATWLADLRAAFGNAQNWYAGIYTACLNLPIMVLCALWGASYLQTVHQLSALVASNVVSLIFMGSAIGCPFVGWLSDQQGQRKPLMIVGAIATGLISLPLLFNITLSISILSLIFFSLGFFTSTQVIGYPLIAESNSPNHTGAATGIASVIIMGGGGIGQVLFGQLMQHHAGLTHSYGVADFQFALWMFPIAALVALAVILRAKETYCLSR